MSTTAIASADAPPVERAGYDPDAATTARRVLPMLADERVVWLSTVHPDGTPHLVPTWFWWDGEALLLWSKPGAVKVRNLRANPRLMVAVGDAAADFSVGLIEATAELADLPVPDGLFRKYGDELAAGHLDPASFAALYTQGIRVVPTRFLAWHGRGAAHAGGPATRRPAFDGTAVSPVPRPCAAARLAGHLAGALERVSARLREAALTPAPPVAA